MPSYFTPAARLAMPGYPFAELERKAAAIRAAGKPVYDLSIGDPDLQPPSYVIEAIRDGLTERQAHCYPSSRGDLQTRTAVANWFRGRFGVELDPSTQVAILIGAKEGIAQIARAVVNPGELVAYPDPGYPVYRRAGSFMLDAVSRGIPLDPDNGFLPDLKSAEGAKLLYLNYPNNPTGAEAPDWFIKEAASLADAYPEMTVAYDMAYSEMCFGDPPKSILQFTANAVEFHSMSKMAMATGYRIGFAVGHPERVAALIRVKEEMDSGAPIPLQRALEAILNGYEGSTPPVELQEARRIYLDRKRRIERALTKAGKRVFVTNATFYIWYNVGNDELPYINRAVDRGLLITPGSGFGPAGKGWVRISVTAPEASISAAESILQDLQ